MEKDQQIETLEDLIREVEREFVRDEEITAIAKKMASYGMPLQEVYNSIDTIYTNSYHMAR